MLRISIWSKFRILGAEQLQDWCKGIDVEEIRQVRSGKFMDSLEGMKKDFKFNSKFER